MGCPGPLLGPLQAPQETREQSPAPASPGPPEGRKPTLAERLDAMQARHPVYTEPLEPETPATDDEAEATLVAAMDPAWVRRFDTYVDADGDTMYVDKATGETYSELPAMHSADGHTI